MPITRSAKKAMRQSATRRTQNVSRSDAYKKAVKNYKKLLVEKKIDEAQKSLVAVYKSLDKAAKTNVIAKNKADRLKSRLTQLIARSTKTSS